MVNIKERFEKKFEKTEGCWEWKAAKLKKFGYGRLRFFDKGKWTHKYAHVVSWIIYRGEIEPGKLVLHKCDNPKCVNPSHLYLGDHLRNIHDILDRNRNHNKNKKLCKFGHELSGVNLGITKSGARFCKECRRRYASDHRKRNPEYWRRYYVSKQ